MLMNMKAQYSTTKFIRVLVKIFEIMLWMLLSIFFLLCCLISFYCYMIYGDHPF